MSGSSESCELQIKVRERKNVCVCVCVCVCLGVGLELKDGTQYHSSGEECPREKTWTSGRNPGVLNI